MKFLTLNGKSRDVNIAPYRIDWDHKVSAPQKAVKDFLYPYWRHHVVLEEFRIPGAGKLRIDLLNLTTKVAIEVSPPQHFEMHSFFHKTRAGFLSSIKRDVAKEKWIRDSGYTYVEIVEDDMEKLSKEWFLETFDITL